MDSALDTDHSCGHMDDQGHILMTIPEQDNLYLAGHNDGIKQEQEITRQNYAVLSQHIKELESEIKERDSIIAELRKSTMVRFSDYMLKHHVWILGITKIIVAFLAGLLASPVLMKFIGLL